MKVRSVSKARFTLMFNMIRQNTVTNGNSRTVGVCDNCDNSFSGCYGYKRSIKAYNKTQKPSALQTILIIMFVIFRL